MKKTDLKKMQKCIKETEALMESLQGEKFWLPAEYEDEHWAMIPNIINNESTKKYVPVFTNPDEFGNEYFTKYGFIESGLDEIKAYLLDGCDGIVLNPFTDSVIVPINYLS